jgi:hypothetical protein
MVHSVASPDDRLRAWATTCRARCGPRSPSALPSWIYDNPDSRKQFFGPGSEPLLEEMDALMNELRESGELIATEPLADPVQAKTVRVMAGAPVITDGPLAEAKEHFGGVLVRRYGNFDACEDAVQEALLAATLQWPGEGVPDNPRGWLLTVASRRVIDELRGESSRRRRERRWWSRATSPRSPCQPGRTTTRSHDLPPARVGRGGYRSQQPAKM